MVTVERWTVSLHMPLDRLPELYVTTGGAGDATELFVQRNKSMELAMSCPSSAMITKFIVTHTYTYMTTRAIIMQA